MMKLLMSVTVVICIILLIMAKFGCTTETAATRSIHSSRVVSTADDLTSSCAVVEEGVPVCQDPEEAEMTATRTPFLQDNWFNRARDDDRKSATESGSRPFGWWWNFVEELKRNLGKKASATTTTARSDVSQLPETIVTYSIKGCSPTIMPFDLSPCSNLSPDVPQPVSTTRVIYYVPPLSRIDRYNPSDFDQ